MFKDSDINDTASSRISNIIILYREEIINICKKMNIYDKVKPQILAYFDNLVAEAESII